MGGIYFLKDKYYLWGMKTLTQTRLKELLHYDPETGVFTWLPRKHDPFFNLHFAGKRTGRVRRYGYRYIGISDQEYAEHRLAWLYVYGAWPSACVDHIDNNKCNNAISNLRNVSRAANSSRPKRSKNPLGKGVYRVGTRYKSSIAKGGAVYYLGLFATPEEARAAYLNKAQELWGVLDHNVF